jgi:hypothetical protein
MLRVHAAGAAEAAFWFLQAVRDKEMRKVKRLLFLPSM